MDPQLYNKLTNLGEIKLEGRRIGPNRRVWLDDQELLPARSLAVSNHSPDGFEWGYGGSGPTQLALAIMLELVPDVRLAQSLYQQFKWDFIASIEGDEFVMGINAGDWMKKNLPSAHVMQ